MKKRALVTGITGQDGSYLAELLLSKDYEVYGLVRRVSTQNYTNIGHIVDKINIVKGDITDFSSLIRAFDAAKPDEVYNLAAQSYVATSWEQPIATMDMTAMGALNVLEATKTFAPNARFYQASSSEMFGNSNTKGIQNEKTPFMPRSSYAIAKLASHHFMRNYRESYGMHACSGILFNHESERRGIDFVTRKITDGVARIKLNLYNKIHLGTLNTKRDWGFAGDYVEAMWLMLQQDNPDDFVVATGENHSVREFTEKVFECAGIKDWESHIVIDPKYKRPAELFELKGDSTKARKKLGWKPKITFEQLVERMVTADLERLSR